MSFYLALSFDSPELIVWSICFGFILGLIATFVVKVVLGKFISSILDTGANNESSTISLNDIGQSGNKFLKLCLRVSGIRGIVAFVDEAEENNKSKSLDFDKVRFYIEDNKKEKATAMTKGGLKWYFLPIFVVLIVIITIIVVKLLPVLTSF
jgi:hypothetical protein